MQSELIEDLLDVSRILQGKLSLNATPINMASTIRAALETVRLPAGVKSIGIEQGGQISAIALTAYAGDFNQQQALDAGFQRHIAKPVELDELLGGIVNLVRRTE